MLFGVETSAWFDWFLGAQRTGRKGFRQEADFFLNARLTPRPMDGVFKFLS